MNIFANKVTSNESKAGYNKTNYGIYTTVKCWLWTIVLYIDAFTCTSLPRAICKNGKPILILFHPQPIASKQPQLVFLPSESDMRGKCIVDPGSDFGKLLWPCSAYERKQPGTYQVGKAVSFEADWGDPFLSFIYMQRELLADQVSAQQHSRSKNALFFFFFFSFL